MKTLFTFIGIISLLFVVGSIKQDITGPYVLSREAFSHWDLADKSSTIEAKRKHIGAFVQAIESRRSQFASHNAVWLKTDANSFETNLTALKTLQGRLEEIQGMNPSSFEYNTAIQQITSQEQGEAGEMLQTIGGCFLLESYPLAWGWIGAWAFLGGGLVFVISCFAVFIHWDD